MKKLLADFKAFITRGNVLDMAVGVVIGGAFSAIVTALVNILLSVCTWAVPGGLKGLVTVLPAISDAQKGVDGIGQSFQASQLNDMAAVYAAKFPLDANPVAGLKGLYTLHGTTYTYNLSAVIDWGAFINAVISFIIIAITLFIIVKIAAASAKKKAEIKARIEKEKYEAWAKAHPEEAAKLEAEKAAAEAEAGKPVVDPVVELLTEIRDSLNKDAKAE